MASSLKTADRPVQSEEDAELAEAEALAHEPIYVTGTPEQRLKNRAALELFKKWEAERAAMTPEQLAQAEKDWEIFKKSMNENRMSYRMRYVD